MNRNRKSGRRSLRSHQGADRDTARDAAERPVRHRMLRGHGRVGRSGGIENGTNAGTAIPRTRRIIPYSSLGACPLWPSSALRAPSPGGRRGMFRPFGCAVGVHVCKAPWQLPSPRRGEGGRRPDEGASEMCRYQCAGESGASRTPILAFRRAVTCSTGTTPESVSAAGNGSDTRNPRTA